MLLPLRLLFSEVVESLIATHDCLSTRAHVMITGFVILADPLASVCLVYIAWLILIWLQYVLSGSLKLEILLNPVFVVLLSVLARCNQFCFNYDGT